MAATGSGRWSVVAPPDLRLVPAVPVAWMVAWWACASSARACGVAAGVALAGCGLLVGLVTLQARRSRRREGRLDLQRAVGPMLLAGVTGGAVLVAAATALAVRSAGPLPGWVADRAVVEVSARAAGDAQQLPEQAAGRFPRSPATGPPPARYAVRVDVGQVTARGLRAPARVAMLVIGGPQWRGVTAGSRLTVTGRLAASSPGDDVVAVLTAYGAPTGLDAGGWVWQLANRVRGGLRQACQGLPADAGGLLPSLVVGDTSGLPASLRDDLRTSGLTHLTAVSGANVAIVAGSALWLAARLGARRAVRITVAGVALAAFVVVARPSPSVLRAAAMGAIGLAALAGGRRRSGVQVLAAAVVVLLVADPWLARSAGFALSSAATAGLILLAPVWTTRLQRWLPKPAAMAVAVPAAAQAACGPLLVLLQPSVSTVAVPANLLAEPAVAPATVLGVIAALLAPLWPGGAHLVASCGAVATGWIAAVAHRCAALPAAALPWPSGVQGALLLTAVTAAFVALTLAPTTGTAAIRLPGVPRLPGRRRPPTSRIVGGPGRFWPVAVVALLVLAPLAGWAVAPALPWTASGAAWPPAGWAVAMCDVGQGDATAVRSGPDRAVLLDVGPDPGLVDGCLRRLGVRHLDLVVLTHHHADHVLGLQGALRGRDVRAGILVSPLAEPAQTAARVRLWAQAAGAPVSAGWAGAAGEVGSRGWQVHWRLLEPDVPPVAGIDGADDGTAVNESSLVAELDVGTPDGAVLRLVALGDLETDGQARLERRLRTGVEHLDGPVDVVKVAHHGSAKQDPGLYALLAPRVGLIGVGAGNDYGHPAPSALGMLLRDGVATFRTDRQGGAAVVAGRELSVLTERG